MPITSRHRTGCDLTPELVATLASEFPNFAGIKDTVDSLSHTRSMIQTTRTVRDDFAVLSGYDEYYIPNLLAGGAGIISGLNNVMPELFVSAREAFKQSDLAALRDIQDQIGTYMSIYAIGEDFVTTIKTVVSRKFGYCSGVDNPAKNPTSTPCSGRMREAIAATTHATRILVITNVPDLRSTVPVALSLIDAPMQKNQTARMGTVPVIIRW